MNDAVAPLDAQQLALVAWLGTSDARAAARSDLRRAGLDWYDPDDLLHDVAVRLLRADLPERIDQPVAYARRAVQLRATDLLRGDLVRDRHTVVPEADAELDLAADGDADARPDELAAAAAAEDAIRRALHLALATTKAWAVAAALNTLTLRVHPDVQLPSAAPRPDAGDEDKADRWAALWLAGESGVFVPEDTPAVRKARSRKLQEVDRLLRAVAASVLGTHG